MKAQKDHHLDVSGKANYDKHINFLAEQNGDVDPTDEQFDENDGATDDIQGDEHPNTFEVNDDDNLNEDDELVSDDEETADADNGFFTDDENELETTDKKENENNLSAKN